ncbi:formate dehydrogenase accessory sulfurtransferase FdhD [Dermacoccaceae bacterium W4C1]
MGRRTRRSPVLRIQVSEEGERRDRRADTLAVEEPLEIRLKGEPWTVTMRLPGDDLELAHGLLRSEGVIAGRQDVLTAQWCAGTDPATGRTTNEYNVLDLVLSDAQRPLPVSAQRSLVMHGGCGLCGKDSIDAVAASLPQPLGNEVGPRLSPEQVLALPRALREHQDAFRRTGGTHAAALCRADGSVLVGREDVGRHNAVDKVLGWALLEEADLSDAVLVVSSRASFELVQKAAMSGVTWLVAVSAPSALAVEAAEELGLTLAGFVRDRSLNVYANTHRLASSV